ncbi:MAG: acetyl-CoA acetyltransferase [Actinomycetota bacterium]|nr:acetyl-CoA acetyltransferase [Actinomycetota bacterium]
MQDPHRIPVLVGVGQVRGNRDRTVDGAREPAELMLDALHLAAQDAGDSRLLHDADSIDTVNVVSWIYDDLPGLLADRLGAQLKHQFASPVGGQWPARLLDEVAARVALGESRIALLAGGEAQSSTGVLAKAGMDPVTERGWSAEPGGPPAFDANLLGSAQAQAAGLIFPTRVYPLFENRLCYELGQTPAEANEWSAQLYADFSRVAARNPVAWNPVARSATDIATVGPDNRMVCEPYPLAMNAMPHVDQAAAVIVTSLATAREYGIPDDRVVYVWGGAGADESATFLHRDGFGGSPAMASTMGRTLGNAGVRAEDLDLVDVYSCFPVVPKLACLALGLPHDASLTVTGGHSSFGGPMNSYTLFSVVAVAQRLRAGGGLALVHGNGGFVTYQHALLLSDTPHAEGYVGQPDPVAITPTAAPQLVPAVSGEVTVETATVEHGRDGQPAIGFLIGRTGERHRMAAQTAPGDIASARALSLDHGETVGRTVNLTVDGGYAGITEQR